MAKILVFAIRDNFLGRRRPIIGIEIGKMGISSGYLAPIGHQMANGPGPKLWIASDDMVLFQRQSFPAESDQAFDVKRILLVRRQISNAVRIENRDFTALRGPEIVGETVHEKMVAGLNAKPEDIITCMVVT